MLCPYLPSGKVAPTPTEHNSKCGCYDKEKNLDSGLLDCNMWLLTNISENETTQCQKPEDHNPQVHSHENLKYQTQLF